MLFVAREYRSVMTDTKSAMVERRRNLLGAAYELFYDDPVHIVKGEGVWLYDANGKRYLDMYNNVPHVGHCHPQVVEAVSRQIATLNTHTRYLHDNILDYAERLTGKFEKELDLAMFCCTGSEANELAMRIASRCVSHAPIRAAPVSSPRASRTTAIQRPRSRSRAPISRQTNYRSTSSRFPHQISTVEDIPASMQASSMLHTFAMSSIP
jgi:4-aminobutyrate aminotransferase-like enzyme